jgi:peptide/nickel transport system substrate-binding protein
MRSEWALIGIGLLLCVASCSRKPDPNTLVMMIENSPTSLDPRVGIDAQSERIDELLFDALVRRDEHFNLQPWLAERWEMPDPLTYIFHLHRGVRFHDGRPLTSRDVKFTLDSVRNGAILTTKTATYQFVDRIDTPNEYTVVIHLKQRDPSLLWNLSDGAMGIVPYGSPANFNLHPIGSGPFKFVSLEQDKDVEIIRNDDYWGERARVERVRFNVVPDTTTRALELQKGSADVAINALTPDMVMTEKRDAHLRVEVGPGTIYTYIALNVRDPVLKDVRVRQALAYAIDRRPLIHYLWRDLVEPARSILPPQSWAFNPDVKDYDYDPQHARQLLDSAGYPVGRDGVRFHLSIKTSTEEVNRLLVAVLQQQLRNVGIALDIRSYEFATFFADIQKGQFQLFTGLRWIGGNQDPDIFEDVFHSASFPPKRHNRGFYSNPQVDALISQARSELNQERRREIYFKVQEILNRDLPYIHLWYLDNVLVHTARVCNLQLTPSGNYDFLATARLVR